MSNPTILAESITFVNQKASYSKISSVNFCTSMRYLPGVVQSQPLVTGDLCLTNTGDCVQCVHLTNTGDCVLCVHFSQTLETVFCVFISQTLECVR